MQIFASSANCSNLTAALGGAVAFIGQKEKHPRRQNVGFNYRYKRQHEQLMASSGPLVVVVSSSFGVSTAPTTRLQIQG